MTVAQKELISELLAYHDAYHILKEVSTADVKVVYSTFQKLEDVIGPTAEKLPALMSALGNANSDFSKSIRTLVPTGKVTTTSLNAAIADKVSGKIAVNLTKTSAFTTILVTALANLSSNLASVSTKYKKNPDAPLAKLEDFDAKKLEQLVVTLFRPKGLLAMAKHIMTGKSLLYIDDTAFINELSQLSYNEIAAMSKRAAQVAAPLQDRAKASEPDDSAQDTPAESEPEQEKQKLTDDQQAVFVKKIKRFSGDEKHRLAMLLLKSMTPDERKAFVSKLSKKKKAAPEKSQQKRYRVA